MNAQPQPSKSVLINADVVRSALVAAQDVTAARHEASEQRFLANASMALASSLDVAALAENLASATVPALAEWCAVHVTDERGAPRCVATAGSHPDPHGSEIPAPVGVTRTGRSGLAIRTYGGNRVSERRAFTFCVPLVAAERTLGTMTLATGHAATETLDMDQLELAEELGRRAGVALHNAAVHTERAATAATLESALLPSPLPPIPGLELAARFRAAGPAARVGGDFYEVFEVDGGWMTTLGDVTGKGPGAAAVTALARHTMRTAAKYEPSPAGVLAHLNDVLAAEADESLPCTALCIRFESLPGGRARAIVASAGHPLPLLARAAGDVQEAGAAGSILGVFPTGEWSDVPVDLEAGDLLVLYTDGVPDTRGPGERFGFARLEGLVAEGAGASADAMAGCIDRALRDFEVGEQADDIALLVVGGATP